MSCNIEKATNKINSLQIYIGNRKRNGDANQKLISELETVKEQLAQAKQLKLEENKESKGSESKTDDKNKNKSIEKELDDIVKTYMIDNKLKFDYKIEKGELGSIFLTMISDDDYDYMTTREIRKLVNEKFNNKDIIIEDDIIPFSVQKVLEQYKKDENIEKENAKLLEYINNNVKFEMNYSKQLAYDFFTGEGITGNYDWKDNVVTIADFDGLRNDKEMMKMLSIEQVNQDTGAFDIKTASTQINIIIDELNKRNIDFTTRLHESVHAAVFNYMISNEGSAYNEEMIKMFEVVKNAAKENTDMFTANNKYWTKNVDEFIAESLSKPELIKDLMKIDVDGNLITGAKKSIFENIIDMIVKALGLSKKEDKVNMHKYLLDSFKTAVEANKAPDRDVKLDKKRYKTINEEDIMQAKDIMLKNKEECR